MALKDKNLHMVTEFMAVFFIVPYIISLLYRYELKNYDVIVLGFIAIATIIIDGYLFLTWYYMKHNGNRKDILKSLIRQSIRYQIASKQDNNILLAVLHANYAATYMFVIKEYFDTSEIIDALESRENMEEFYKRIIETQDSATGRAVEECPAYGGRELDDFLAKIAGE